MDVLGKVGKVTRRQLDEERVVEDVANRKASEASKRGRHSPKTHVLASSSDTSNIHKSTSLGDNCISLSKSFRQNIYLKDI